MKLNTKCHLTLKLVKPEHWVVCLIFRKALASFRSSAHHLMIEKGRHYQIPREFRNCIYCECYIEDEFHFILVCPLYEDLRVQYIPHNFIQARNVLSFIQLMSVNNEETIRNLAMFIHYAYKKRRDFLSGMEWLLKLVQFQI